MGRLAEDGTIPERYPVIELANASYAERTAKNVADSDGTLIICNGELMGGTRETVERCMEKQRPYLVIDCSVVSIDEAIASALKFIRALSSRPRPSDDEELTLQLPPRDSSVRTGPAVSLGMTVLNVAGPRASQWPEGHALTYQIMSAILRRIIGQKGAN